MLGTGAPIEGAERVVLHQPSNLNWVMPAEGVEVGKRVLVITGGEERGHSECGYQASDAPYDLVIAADGGLDLAESLNIRPDIVVGDFDSASPDAVERARGAGVSVESHPAEKDQTDFALALQRAVEEGASEIGVIGGSGGRPDHWLANLALLVATARRGIGVEADMGGWCVTVVDPGHPYAEERPAGELMSLLPMHGDVCGVTTAGLSYPLTDEDLPAGSSRGVSNVSTGGLVHIDVQEGVLLVMRPQQPGSYRNGSAHRDERSSRDEVSA